MTNDPLLFFYIGCCLIGLHFLSLIASAMAGMTVELLKAVGRYFSGIWRPDPATLRAKDGVIAMLDRERKK